MQIQDEKKLLPDRKRREPMSNIKETRRRRRKTEPISSSFEEESEDFSEEIESRIKDSGYREKGREEKSLKHTKRKRKKTDNREFVIFRPISKA